MEAVMDDSGIKEVIQLYFDGCSEGDTGKIERVFHDAAHIYGHGENGTLVDWPKDAFVKVVGSHESNAQNPTPRHDEIVSIDFTGENAAVARVKISVGKTLYTDVLSFLRLEGKWGVISKMYSGAPLV